MKPIHFTCANDLPDSEMQWLWKPYIPKGALSLLAGDPGMGKSYLTCALAADLSRGRPFPGQGNQPLPPRKTLFLSAEDDPTYVIKPRLMKQGADISKIFISDRVFTLDAKTIKETEAFVAQMDITIMFIDPIQAWTGGKMDIHKANEVRELMAQLADMAKNTGCSIMTVMHLRKGTSDQVASSGDIYRILGSIDFVGATRSALIVNKAKDGSRYVTHAKSNYGPIGASLGYSIVEDRFQWGGEVDAESIGKVSKVPLKFTLAQKWLRECLKNGELPCKDIIEECKKMGISDRTLREAGRGIISIRKGAPGDGWYWRLSDDA